MLHRCSGGDRPPPILRAGTRFNIFVPTPDSWAASVSCVAHTVQSARLNVMIIIIITLKTYAVCALQRVMRNLIANNNNKTNNIISLHRLVYPCYCYSRSCRNTTNDMKTVRDSIFRHGAVVGERLKEGKNEMRNGPRDSNATSRRLLYVLLSIPGLLRVRRLTLRSVGVRGRRDV